MEIGSKIKLLRMEHGLTQEELANRSGLTKGFISQLEKEKTSPSISTLHRILTELDTTLGDFFTETDKQIVYTKDDILIKKDEDYKIIIQNLIKDPNNKIKPVLLELQPNGLSYKHKPHVGEEFGYVLEGEIELFYGNQKFLVREGESFYYEALKDHYIKNYHDHVSKVIWIAISHK